MSITNTYKTTDARYRVMTSESTFAKGMRYTDNPLVEGYAKVICNYDLANDGATLKTRAGYKALSTDVMRLVADTDDDVCVFMADQLLVNLADNTDAYLCRAALLGATKAFTETEQKLGLPKTAFKLSGSKMMIYYKNQYITGVNINAEKLSASATDDAWYLGMQLTPDNVHGAEIATKTSRVGTYTVMDNNAYVPVWHTYTDNEVLKIEKYLGILDLQFNAMQTTFNWYVRDLKPNSITAVQAVNYGYNMLLDSPYTFENKQTASGTLLLDGILPYDTDGNLLTSARPGAEIIFHLIYRYPESDVTKNKKYYVQWEIQNLDDTADPIVIQQVRQSQAYTPGNDITFRTTQTTYKSFTLIAKVYYKDVVDATVYTDSSVTTELNDAIHLEPLKVITLAYYYLTDDSDTTTLNVKPANYELGTASGMCTWQQRLVVWGVRNAKNTLWVSEINDPSWFPYPNNCEIFPDEIVACIKYKTSLLVFTKSALYQLTFNEDGLTYTTTCIQERLTLEAEDATSIIPVQSMVFFKNGNYYYMVVPVTGSTIGELQLAPITRPIESAFEDILGFVKKELFCLDTYEHTLSLTDWWCELEQRTMRVTFKVCDTLTLNNVQYLLYYDVSFNYDTKLRTWTTYMVGSSKYRKVAYIPSITATTVYLAPVAGTAQTGTIVNLVQADPTLAIDTNALKSTTSDGIVITKIFDTGYRDINADLMKRFRQIQFRVHNPASAMLTFVTTFKVDNDVRKDLFTYELEEITDKEASDYGSVYVTPEAYEDGDTMEDLPGTKAYMRTWSIPMNRFPELTTVQIKVNVSGKGKLGQFRIIDVSNTDIYEINSLAWVYRAMWGR